MNKSGYLVQFAFRLFDRFPADKRLRALRELLAYQRPKIKPGTSAHIVVQSVQDPFYLTLFANITYALRQRTLVNVKLFIPHSINQAVGFDLQSFFLRTFPLNRLLVNQWVNLWDVVSSQIAYRSTSLSYPLGDLIDVWRSWKIWRQLDSADELETVSISGVACGDLIIDTYLRFRPSPRVVISDLFMLHILWQAHRDVRRAKHYFHSTKPLLYITTYTTYIQHGIATRAAIQEGVPVISFGNGQEFGMLHDDGYAYQVRNSLFYRRDFELLRDPLPLLDLARTQLEARLSGSIDTATAYMKKSAYLETTDEVPHVQDAVIVFLHDFYDSPHVYPDLVFPDFWEWVCFTLDTLRSAGIRCLVKPHPNQITLSDKVIDELLVRFPDIELIAPEVTNRQLVDAGMACAVSVYGTVAHEMAYMGVPTIACARHPHIAFDFCRTAKNRADYADLLRDALRPVISRELLREQALQFFVMHNLNYSAEQIRLRDALTNAWKAFEDPLSDATQLVDHFENIVKLPYFSTFIDKIIDEISLENNLKC
jgi:hypothetical protein